MILKSLKFGQKTLFKTLLLTFEAAMVLLVLAMVGGGALVWKLNRGPIEVGFARKFLESELSDPARDLSLRVEKVFLDWSAIDSRPRVTLQDVRILNTATDHLVLSVKSAAVSMSRTSLLLGQFEPRTIVIEKPLLTVVRDQDNEFHLAISDSADTAEKPAADLHEQSALLFSVMDTMAKPRNEIPRDWPVRSLELFMISGARMRVEDRVLQQSWLVPKADMAFRRERGTLVTTASLWLEDTAVPAPTLQAEAAYIRDRKSIVADVSLTNLRAPFLASKFPDLDWLKNQNIVLNGKAQAQLGENFSFSGFEATLESSNGAFAVPDVYETPVPFQKMLLNIAYDHRSGSLTLKDSNLALTDDFSMTFSGSVDPVKESGGYSMPLHIAVHSLPQARVATFWPAVMKGDPSEEWALRRLADGRIFDSTIDLALNADRAEGEWSVTLADLKAAFNIENMTVDYSAPLMPVKKANGKGVYNYKEDRMTIDVASGMLGDMTIKSGKIVVDTVIGAKIGHASIDAHLQGPLKTVFKYISSEPINVAGDIVSDMNKIEGSADLQLNVSFPTLKELPAEKIDVTATGTGDKILMPGLVNKLDVSGGPVKVAVKDKRVDVSGKGRIDGRDMNFTYAQYFEAKGNPFGMQVVADVMADSDLRQKFGIDLSDWIEGSVPAKITYTDFGGGRAEVDADVDATPATLMVKPMSYTKPPGKAARASAKAYLQNNILTEIKNLSVETPEGRVEGAQMRFVQSGKETLLKSGEFPRARLNESDVAIKFDISPQNIISMSIQGPFLDARPFLENDKKGADYHGPGLIANVSVARMRTAEARLIEKAVAAIDMDTQGELNRLTLDATAGAGPLLFRYQPEGNRMILRISAQDGGAALLAFGVYENTRGGQLLVEGASAPGGDKKLISGKAELTNFRVINAPVLARLVNALSLPGILSLLGSDGIDFARLESQFTWEKRKGVDLIRTKEGRTSGASMGLTFEGALDRMADNIDVSGTIVPASMLNSILSSIPIVGDILTAGSGDAVFAATYTVKGPAKNPTIMVNPLAVLAPGFLRQIFFE
ncbi:MAG: heme utilization protein [Micavibrio aeruginosavorus]|nr:heme utilization protein [Micavibrio aeruginosavorus]